MKKYLSIFFVSACLLTTACSSDDNGYDADTAITSYTPMPVDKYKMVKGIKISQNYNGRDYTWDYKFNYDAQNRIKNVLCDIIAYAKDKDTGKMHKVTGTISADYRFEKNDILVVNSHITNRSFNDNSEYKYIGEFNNSGYLEHFGMFDCVYNGNTLKTAFVELNDREYSFEYDRSGNITGYVCDSADVKIIAEHHDIYKYSSQTNRINIDIAGFIGNNVIEREIAGNENVSYPILFLSTFDMLGMRSNNLPKGEWVFDENNLPVKVTLPTGQNLEFEY